MDTIILIGIIAIACLQLIIVASFMKAIRNRTSKIDPHTVGENYINWED